MLKKKRILLVTHDFTVTGAPLSLLNVAKILQKDYDISVWGLSGGALFSRYGKDLDIEPIILSNKYKKHPSLLLPKLNKFDFVILNTVVNKKLASVCQNNGIPYIWTIREGQNLVCWYNKKLVKIIKKCQKNIYVVSEYAKEYIDKSYGVDVKVIHNLVPDEYFDFKKQKSDKLTFTFLGSIEKRKGIDLIIDAFLEQKNLNWKLNICGGGELEHQLKEISKNCPNIKWQGVVTGDTRRKIFENTDIFLVPSLDEACSRVVLEAMMMACPVIISQNVGAKYMVNDNTGWIVKTGDVESLKICIENILKNPEKIQTMKKYARQMYLSTSTEEIYRKNIYSIIEKNLKQPVISKLKRMLFSKSYLFIDKLFDLSRLLFSVTNKTEGSKCRKVITFLGFKLKLRNKKKERKILANIEWDNLKSTIETLKNQNKKLIELQNKTYNQVKIKNENKILSFRTVQNLSDLIRDKISILPEDIDLIVGIPRSGVIPAYLIALFLNKKVCTLNEFIHNLEPQNGCTRPVSQNVYKKDKEKILIVDDSICSGKSMDDAKKQILTNVNLDKYDIQYCAIFALEQSKDKVDYIFETVSMPRMFQWNYLNHANAKISCFDMDGVLCVDPTEEQNDDGPKYIDFILNAKPLYIPAFKINSIVTSRLEKYRLQTERWLKEHNVQYDNLYMLDLPTAEERRKLNCHAEFKAKIYIEKEDCNYFIESNRAQAEKIAQITGKQVICVDTDEYFCG